MAHVALPQLKFSRISPRTNQSVGQQIFDGLCQFLHETPPELVDTRQMVPRMGRQNILGKSGKKYEYATRRFHPSIKEYTLPTRSRSHFPNRLPNSFDLYRVLAILFLHRYKLPLYYFISGKPITCNFIIFKFQVTTFVSSLTYDWTPIVLETVATSDYERTMSIHRRLCFPQKKRQKEWTKLLLNHENLWWEFLVIPSSQ